MNDQLKAFQRSFALHAIVLLLFIVIGGLHTYKERTLVIDFTLEEPVVSQGYQNRPAARDRGQRLMSTEPAIVERKQENPAQHIKDNLRTAVQTVQEISAVDTQATALANNETSAQRETVGTQNLGVKPQSNASVNATSSGGGKAKAMSSGVSANATASRKAGYLKAHFSYIRDLINRKIVYPPSARHNGWEGKVKVSFTILSDGDVRNIRVVQSSGREILDKNAVAAVERASPFPKPPVEAQIIIPILYRLN